MTWVITIPAAASMGAVILALVQAFIRRGQL
jgi:phosphate/sulfate permease